MKKKIFFQIAFASAALEYGWICGASAYLASLYSQIQFLGVLLGTVITGTLSDIFGRRPLALISLACGITVSFCSGSLLFFYLIANNLLVFI